MELLIVICLLIVILLLISDKIVIIKPQSNKKAAKDVNAEMPNIMGVPKPVERHSMPIKAVERLVTVAPTAKDNFDEQTSEDDLLIAIPQEELDEVFEETLDLTAEEEEWNNNREPNGEGGFATGVTFEELSAVGAALQEEMLAPSAKIGVVDIVQKIQGTELFSLLENSIENFSQNIARLLDNSLLQQTNFSSSTSHKNGLDGFDIGEFV